MPDCVFCDLRAIEKRLIASTTSTYARWDGNPATPGHVLILPKRHVASVFDLDPEESRDMAAFLLAAPKWIKEFGFPADGYTIGYNEGEAAGRTVPHVHQHVIPRLLGDMENPEGGIRLGTPNANFDNWMAKIRGEHRHD